MFRWLQRLFAGSAAAGQAQPPPAATPEPSPPPPAPAVAAPRAGAAPVSFEQLERINGAWHA